MPTPPWIVALTLSLSACATAASSPPPSVCPSLVPYTLEEQTAAAAELAALPAEAELGRMMGDYAVTRAEIRACRGEGER